MTGEMRDQGRELRFAILCDRDSLERWQARCVEYLLAVEGVESAAVILAEGAARPVRPSQTLFRLYASRLRRRQLRNSVELSDVAVRAPRIRIEPQRENGDALVLSQADLDTVRGLELDFLLSLGVDPLSGPILDIPRYGVWIFDFDHDWTERVGLGELWRVLSGETVTEVALLRLTSTVNRTVILRRGWFRTDDRTPWAGLARVRDESAKWPAWVCVALARGESSRFEGQVVRVKPAGHPVPGLLQTVRLPAVLLRNRLRTAWARLFRHPQWNIGIVEQPIHTLLRAKSHPPVRWYPLDGRRGFLADPFGVRRGADATILCEYFDYRRAKGTICCIDVSGGDFASAPQSALELSVHASYPCLVEDEGALYCVPEANRTREVSLFKADPFPRHWTKVGTLVRNVSAIDPTVFRHSGRWWLMCIDGDTAADVNLLVWHARSLEGPWTPHAANPVKTDVRSVRPAGTPFEYEGRLYRPAQDCSRTYGGSIVINEVTRLTPEEFAEDPVVTIGPTSDSPYPAGRHTLSTLGDTTLIDGHRFVFVGAALWHFLRIWGADLVSAATNRLRRQDRDRGMTGEPRPAADRTDPNEAHMERLEKWFGSHSRDWTESYRTVRRVNDLVLIDRKNITVAFVRQHVPPGGRILDAGCGAGWASLDLVCSGYSLHGVDAAQEMIDECERTFAQAGVATDRYAFTCAELLSVDLPLESFEAIVALGVLQYQVQEEQLLERLNGLLRPGGLLVVTGPIERELPNYFGTVAIVGSLLRRLKLLGPRPPTTGRTQHRYSLARFRRLLHAAGFDVLGHRGHGFGDWLIIGGLIGFRGELVLHCFLSWLATFTPVGLWGNDLVVAARKRN